MNKCKLSVFPGQGAQYPGMGKELFEKYEYHTRLSDNVLGYSIFDLCQDESDKLSKTEFTQPALYVVNILQYLNNVEDENNRPDYLAGHSLGEYCALFAAGAFTFETGLRIVEERGKLMSMCKNGTMAAILGLTHDNVATVIKEEELDNIVIANINSPSQVVISGDEDQVASMEAFTKDAGGIYHHLKVSGAFHSARMVEISDSFRDFLSTCMFFPLKIPVLSNVTANIYPSDCREKMIELLVQQLYKPVLWQQSIENISKENNIEISEYGPKKILTNLIKEIIS